MLVQNRGSGAGRATHPHHKTHPAEEGFTIVEIVVTLVAIGVLMAMTMPAFYEIYRQRQIRNAATQVSMVVRFARLQAVKEKVRYRVEFKDEFAGTRRNMANLQFESGGSFADFIGQQHRLDEPVKILGGGGQDSMDSLTVSRRGECTPGNVYLEGHGGAGMTLTFSSTCAITYN